MFPAGRRLRTPADFTTVIRGGHKAARRSVVLHLRRADEHRPGRAGLIVSRAVGNAVTRNRVKRRLRALISSHWSDDPDADVVVRALPVSAELTWDELAADVDRAWHRAAQGRR
ncbi:ribonuclease P protein component [Tersicoccus solisilvae]|nr:ribonuclease P protein component [Tersicoccus solisilvae]